MAICFAFMFGRLGAVAGSNISAVLFDGYCEHAFYLPSLALIGNLLHTREDVLLLFLALILTVDKSLCFFIFKDARL